LTKLFQFYEEQSSIIAATNASLWWRDVASFHNEGGSRTNGIETRGHTSHFMTPVKKSGVNGEKAERENRVYPKTEALIGSRYTV